MTERALQNKILEILYTRYKDGKSGIINFSEIEKMIPGLEGTSRVSDACHVLHDKKYITCMFMTNGSGAVSQITAMGREYVEENILKKSTVKEEAVLTGEDGNRITIENAIPLEATIDINESNDSGISKSFKTKSINNGIKDKNVPPCFGIDGIADSFLTQIDKISSTQADNVCMIGIFGEWGRGKSYFFKRLEEKINKREVKNSIQYDIVEFNAWKYQDTPALWAYLFETVYHKACFCRKVLYYFRRNIWSWSFLYQILLFAIPTIILTLSKLLGLIKETTTAPFWIVGVLSVVVLVLKLINENKDIALSLIKKLQPKPDFSQHLGVQAEVEKELESLLKSWIWKSETSKRKVLLFVDDIDRCPFSKMTDIVESLRVVLENEKIRKRLIVVCSIDPAKLKADISNRLKQIVADEEKLNMYVTEQLDKLFIFCIGLCRLSHSQICQYLDTLIMNNDKASQPSNPSSSGSSPVDTSRIIGSFITTSNPEEPIEVNETDYLDILKEELSKNKNKVITPRKARIIYYRILFANNILSANTGCIITDSLVKQIIDKSLNNDINIDTNAAYSDIIDMVVPY